MTPERPNRLTRIGDRTVAALHQDAEHRPGDKTIIIMHDSVEGGTTLDGYEAAEWEAIEDLYKELARIARHNGGRLVILTDTED